MADAGDYKMLGGIAVFFLVLMSGMTLFSASYVGKGTIVNGPTFPPTNFIFGNTTWPIPPTAPAAGDMIGGIIYIGQSIAYFFALVGTGLFWVISYILTYVGFFLSFFTFSIPALDNGPQPLPILSIGIKTLLIVVVSLFIIRLIRSVVPWLSGE